MPVTRIRPNGVNTAFYPNRVAASSGTANSATSDQSDATYIRKSVASGTAPMVVFTLGDHTTPAGSDLLGIAPGLRYKRPGSAALTIAQANSYLRLIKLADGRTRRESGIRQGAYSVLAACTVATDASATRQTTPVLPSNLMLCVKDASAHTDANRATIYEAYVDVYELARPTVSLSVNGGTTPVVTTSLPEISVTVSALIEAWQGTSHADGDIEVRIYTQEQYDAVGFNPTTSEPYWSTVEGFSALPYGDGATPSTQAVAVTLDYPLQPTGNYRAYACARRTGGAYGAQSYTAFAMDITPLPVSMFDFQVVPLSAAYPDIAPGVNIQRFTMGFVEGQFPANYASHSDRSFEFQRADPLTGVWETVAERPSAPGENWFPSPGGATHYEYGYDYFAPRGEGTLQYRCRVSSTLAGARVTTDWMNTTNVVSMDALSGWNVTIGYPNDVWKWTSVKVLKDPDYQQTEDVGVFRPKGRRYPVVVSNALGGADGSLTVRATDSIERTNLTDLREAQAPVFLESPFGWSRWIRIIGRSWSESGTPGSPRYTAKFDFVEVEAP